MFTSKESWDAHQQKIRERAYFLWQEAGEPDGFAAVYWALARYYITTEKPGADYRGGHKA